MANTALWAWVAILRGGTALGTTPREEIFQLAARGHLTTVSEGEWIFNLFYSWAALLLLIVGFWVLLPYLGRIEVVKRNDDAVFHLYGSKLGIILFSIVGLVGFYLVNREGFVALRAWFSMR